MFRRYGVSNQRGRLYSARPVNLPHGDVMTCQEKPDLRRGMTKANGDNCYLYGDMVATRHDRSDADPYGPVL